MDHNTSHIDHNTWFQYTLEEAFKEVWGFEVILFVVIEPWKLTIKSIFTPIYFPVLFSAGKVTSKLRNSLIAPSKLYIALQVSPKIHQRHNSIWIIPYGTSLTVPTVPTDLVIKVLKSVSHLKSTCLDYYRLWNAAWHTHTSTCLL